MLALFIGDDFVVHGKNGWTKNQKITTQSLEWFKRCTDVQVIWRIKVWYQKFVHFTCTSNIYYFPNNLVWSHSIWKRDAPKSYIIPHPFPGLNHAVSVKLLTSSCPLALSTVPPESKDCLKRNDPPCSPETAITKCPVKSQQLKCLSP